MADGFKLDFKAASLDAAFAALDSPQLKESLARRMLVSGGVLLRDQAKANALIADNKEGVARRGLLSAAIYLAYNDTKSKESFFSYSVTWSSKTAPHGHLVEFGHLQTHKVYKGSDGNWYTRKDVPLAAPRRVPARPFLRPAFDTYGSKAVKAMMERGKKEFPELIKELAK